jgi:hypothetical protein
MERIMNIVIGEMLYDASGRRSRIQAIARKSDAVGGALSFDQVLGEAVVGQVRPTAASSAVQAVPKADPSYIQAINVMNTGRNLPHQAVAAVHQEIPVQYARKPWERERR